VVRAPHEPELGPEDDAKAPARERSRPLKAGVDDAFNPDYSREADILVCLARCERLRDSGRLGSLPRGFVTNPG
jgi:hypothetical protein